MGEAEERPSVDAAGIAMKAEEDARLFDAVPRFSPDREQQRLEGLLEQLTAPMFVWRMARGLTSSAAPRVAAAAERRRAKALEEVAAIIKRHNALTERLKPSTEES